MPSAAPVATGASANFLRKNWQILYAVLLIVLVPVTIILNTVFVVNRFRNTVDVELQRAALIVGKMLNVTSLDLLNDQDKLQERLKAVAVAVPEARSLDVLKKEGEEFVVFASLYEDGIGREAHGTQNILAWYDDRAIAYLTKSGRSAAQDQTLTTDEARSPERFWGVVMPLKNAAGDTVLLLSMKLSLASIDGMVQSNLFWSYAWLLVTVLVVMLILASNTRLFQYASLYRRLQQADQMKDDFISMASHELRAPIAAIRGYLSLFIEDAFGKVTDEAKENMRTTFAISTHLGTLVDDLLEVSRIEQGRMKVDLEPTQIEPVIDEVMSQMAFEAKKKNLEFTYTRPAQPLPMVMLDRQRFLQVLINLCSNAIKYTPSGSVTVTTEVRDGHVDIRVIDTGLGMNAEQREKLFQKFYRVKTTETTGIVGTGLGLWITKQLVELMRGRISVDSIEKVGTQMSVTFPVIPPDAI